MIRTGFTYRNRHSSEFNIVCDPESRVLLPEKRRERITIPGRDGSYVFSRGNFEERREQFTCYYLPDGNRTTAQVAREIAAWLAEDGELSFDSEPDKFYMASFRGDAPMQQHLRYGEFELEFTYNPPFALSALKTIPIHTGSNPIEYHGTAPAPAKLTLTNVGNTTISNIQIIIRRRKG